jgi:amidase
MNISSQSESEYLRMSAVQVRDLLKRKKISSYELTQTVLNRIADLNPIINAIPTICAERALKHARALDNLRMEAKSSGDILAGIPLCIKDLTTVAGVRTTWGTLGYKDFIPSSSDPIVDRLELSGGIIIGKSNTPEMGAGNFTSNQVFGITRNPWDISRSPGGSSGGTAAAVASGMVWFGHGTDLAGSLRNPAAYCGVVAIRPTPGRAGGPPLSVLFNTETVHGPIARSVKDAALLLDAMVGYDMRIPISIESPHDCFLRKVEEDDGRIVRIGYSHDLNGFADVDSSIENILDLALENVDTANIRIDKCQPSLPDLFDTYTTLRLMLWGSGPGSQPEDIQKHYNPALKSNITQARELSSADIYRALSNRSKLYRAMLTFFEVYDCLACPVIGKGPDLIQEESIKSTNSDGVTDYVKWLRFSFLSPATCLPAMSIPVGLDQNGMPVGIQLIGKPRGEAELLIIASRLESSFGFNRLPIIPRGTLNISEC